MAATVQSTASPVVSQWHYQQLAYCPKRARLALGRQLSRDPKRRYATPPVMMGPNIWWVRNDLRLEDNPVLRAAVGVAITDDRPFQPIFVFDPRFIDRSSYGDEIESQPKTARWLDKWPDQDHHRTASEAATLSSRKTGALRMRFWIQSVLELRRALEAVGSKLVVCYGKSEEVLGELPWGSEVKCQDEVVSAEMQDMEQATKARLQCRSSKLRRVGGATSLYNTADLPFPVVKRPESYIALGKALGWKDIGNSIEQEDGATPIRKPLPAPASFPRLPVVDMMLPGLIAAHVLEDETKMLQLLGFTSEEIKATEGIEMSKGGEVAAQTMLDAWVEEQNKKKNTEVSEEKDWELPCAHYMAVGCISARDIFERVKTTPRFAGMVERLVWRDFHRLYTQKDGRVAWLAPSRVERLWEQDVSTVEAWKQGLTGVPYFDACQRQLQQTGVHADQGRKTAAKFLIQDLGLDWRIGAFHDEEVLLDYDFAVNYGNWASAATVANAGWTPWYGKQVEDTEHSDLKLTLRLEQEKDPSGAFIRRWVPELRNVDSKHIHTPWLMSDGEMQACGCKLGRRDADAEMQEATSRVDYPLPLLGAFDISKLNLEEVPAEASTDESA